jgi:predicted O-methyltransferase YrrM
VTETVLGRDAPGGAALAANAGAGLPPADVSPPQGALLELLARLRGARAILELGTLGGYSTIWLARGLAPGGTLLTVEVDPERAALARRNVAAAGLAAAVEVRAGDAAEVLPQLVADGRGPFDLVFIDADKERNPEYLRWSVALAAPGTLIVADNTVRGGAVTRGDSHDPVVRGVRRFHELVGADPRLVATVIQTVGAKGYDGLTLALVR